MCGHCKREYDIEKERAQREHGEEDKDIKVLDLWEFAYGGGLARLKTERKRVIEAQEQHDRFLELWNQARIKVRIDLAEENLVYVDDYKERVRKKFFFLGGDQEEDRKVKKLLHGLPLKIAEIEEVLGGSLEDFKKKFPLVHSREKVPV